MVLYIQRYPADVVSKYFHQKIHSNVAQNTLKKKILAVWASNLLRAQTSPFMRNFPYVLFTKNNRKEKQR